GGRRSGLDDLAEPDVAGRDARDRAVLAADDVGGGVVVVELEHADRLADVAVRELELEGHALAEVLRRHEVLAFHEPEDIGPVSAGGRPGARATRGARPAHRTPAPPSRRRALGGRR